MTIQVTILISVVSLCITTYLGFKNSNRADTSTTEEKARQQAIINVKLDTIVTDVRDIKYDISETKKTVQEHDTKIALLDSSLRSLHHRMDEKFGQDDQKGGKNE